MGNTEKNGYANSQVSLRIPQELVDDIDAFTVEYAAYCERTNHPHPGKVDAVIRLLRTGLRVDRSVIRDMAMAEEKAAQP